MHKMNSDKHPIQYKKTGAKKKKEKPANNTKIKHWKLRSLVMASVNSGQNSKIACYHLHKNEI